MGASSSCQVESLSQALNAAGMSHMLDDFFFIEPKHSQKCLQDINQFIYMCEESGFPIKMEKKPHFPTKIITIYGTEVDSNEMVCRLPDQKLVKIRLKLQEVKHRKQVTLKV